VNVIQLLKALIKNFAPASFRMREVRIRIFSSHNIAFDLYSGAVAKKLNIINISTSGIAFSRDPDSSWQALGQKLTGQLVLLNKQFRVSLEVRHVTQNNVGCRFVSTEANLENAIQDYLIYEITSSGLKKVNSEYLAPTADGTVQWFVDTKGNEIYVVDKSGTLIRYHMVFLGNYVEWSAGGPLKVGIVLSDRDSKPMKHKGSHVVRFSETIPKEMGLVVSRLLENVREISQETKMQIEKTFK
jgi:hypothetical protein